LNLVWYPIGASASSGSRSETALYFGPDWSGPKLPPANRLPRANSTVEPVHPALPRRVVLDVEALQDYYQGVILAFLRVEPNCITVGVRIALASATSKPCQTTGNWCSTCGGVSDRLNQTLLPTAWPLSPNPQSWQGQDLASVSQWDPKVRLLHVKLTKYTAFFPITASTCSICKGQRHQPSGNLSCNDGKYPGVISGPPRG
jgi:hypothetical protein